jgi:hypothetical protein
MKSKSKFGAGKSTDRFANIVLLLKLADDGVREGVMVDTLIELL